MFRRAVVQVARATCRQRQQQHVPQVAVATLEAVGPRSTIGAVTVTSMTLATMGGTYLLNSDQPIHCEAPKPDAIDLAAENKASLEQLKALKGKDFSELDVVLYQYEVCPFCCKLRAFLDFNKIPYRIVEVDPLRKKEISFSKYRKVPILTIDGIQLNDSTAIISALSSILPSKRLGSSPSEEKWRSWVDDYLVHLLPANIYRSPSESLESFDYISKHTKFTASQQFAARYTGAVIMYGLSKLKLNKKYGIKNPREELYVALKEWLDNGLEGKKFNGGDSPNLADLAVYGVMSSVETLSVFQDVSAHSDFVPWYQGMKQHVGQSTGKPDASM